MEFRPCIDIHNGKVKQIVGGSLKDAGDFAKENFVSNQTGGDFAKLYKKKGLKGGHIILLNSKESPYYEADLEQAKSAFSMWQNGLQIGGGINDQNAKSFLDMGASHVIVTSFVFENEDFNYRLESLVNAVGKDHIVLDLSCRKKDDKYYIVTDRWQKFTKQALDTNLFTKLQSYCDEFLIHAVNVEGTGMGVDKELLKLLSTINNIENFPVTYAGGIGSIEDINTIMELGNNNINFTIGSALDIFGGKLSFEEICNYK